jgi:hypothetical protein
MMERLNAMERDHRTQLAALAEQHQQQLHQQQQQLQQQLVLLQGSSTALNEAPSPVRVQIPKRARSEAEESDFLRDTRAILGILFAKVRINQGDIVEFRLATLDKEFETALKLDNKVLQPNWDRVHAACRAEMRRNPHYLATAASEHFICPLVLMKKICSGSIFGKPFGQLERVDDLKHNWALTHFAPEEKSPELTHFKACIQAEEDDVLFEQNYLHSVKKETTLFIQGSFDSSVDALLSTIANFILFARTVVDAFEWGESPHNPSIVNYMFRLADLLSTNESKRAIIQLQVDAPHIIFAIFSGFQDIVGAYGQILRETKAVNIAREALTTLTYDLSTMDAFDYIGSPIKGPHNAYLSFQRSLKELLNTRSLGTFAFPARSFHAIHPRIQAKVHNANAKDTIEEGAIDSKLKRVRNGKDKARDKTPQGNWLMGLGGTTHREFKFPPDLVNAFCIRWAFNKISCNRPECTWPHIGHGDLTSAQKSALAMYIEANKTKFALAK